MITDISQLNLIETIVNIILSPFTLALALATVILARKTYTLTRKDKEKTIAIDELQKQTKQLENLYLDQLRPRFAVKKSSSDYYNIVNIGGEGYNFKIEILSHSNPNLEKVISNLDSEIPSQGTIQFGRYMSTEAHLNLYFDDRLGNKFQQEFDMKKRRVGVPRLIDSNKS